jgi:hypothetical protein
MQRKNAAPQQFNPASGYPQEWPLHGVRHRLRALFDNLLSLLEFTPSSRLKLR